MKPMRMLGSPKARLNFFMIKSQTGKTLPRETRFCYTTLGFIFLQRSWRLISLDRLLCAPFSHTVLWLLSILRTTWNSKWMGKGWSLFWPLSLHHPLIVCWLFLTHRTPDRSHPHYNLEKKLYFLFICLPLLYFFWTFLSPIRAWSARVDDGGNIISSPYLLHLHLHDIHWGQCIW